MLIDPVLVDLLSALPFRFPRKDKEGEASERRGQQSRAEEKRGEERWKERGGEWRYDVTGKVCRWWW